MSAPPEQPAPRFFLLLLAAMAVALGAVVLPIAADLLLAAVLGGMLWPLQRWLGDKLGGRRTLAASILTVSVVLLLLGPLSMLVTFVVRDGADAVRFLSETLRSDSFRQMIDGLPASARDLIADGIARMPRSLDEALGDVGVQGDQAAALAGAAVAATGSFLFHAAMMLIALFFFLVRGDAIIDWLDEISPLRRGQTHELLAAFKNVSYAVIASTAVTSAVQAVVALVGYAIARVPNPYFFASVTFFVAFIPAIGAAAVCLVAAALLLITGHPYAALFLAIWGVVAVGLVDNLVKPLLIRRGMEVHGAVVFFSLVGGIAAFGAIGMLIGPLVVAAFLALVRMYHRDFSPASRRVPSVPGLPAVRPRPGEPPLATPAADSKPVDG